MEAISLDASERSEVVSAERSDKHSYREILKSSAWVGGSTVLNIAVGMVRTKATAALLGPAGFGLNGLYSSVSELAISIAGMGVNSSGVRQIAEAAGAADQECIARTAFALRRVSVVLGLLGAALLIVFSQQISALTFGTPRRAPAICVLSVVVLFKSISNGQAALIQGLRRISDLAKMNVLAAVFGTIFSIPLIYFFREQGIIPALIGVAGMTILTSWHYSRKYQIQTPRMRGIEVWRQVVPLLKLGAAFMVSGLMMMGSAYAVRIIVLRQLGFEATGLYQCAWTLGGLYVGFILQAMGADFYPRLTACARDNVACNRLVNEQARVGLLLAGAGVTATLTFAPLVIWLFYNSKFAGAADVLRWICLGATLQVVTWPMGYIVLAKGKQNIFFWSELAWTAVYVSLAWICVKWFGVVGAGVAFFVAYLFHGVLIYPIVRHLSGFRWSAENVRTGLFSLALIAIVFSSFYLLPLIASICVGALCSGLSAFYSLRVFLELTPAERIPPRLRHWMGRIGLRQLNHDEH